MPSLTSGRADVESKAIQRFSQAWAEFTRGRLPDRVEMLKAPRRHGKSVVLRLGRLNREDQGVVAKELLADAAAVELRVYEEVLPQLRLRGPELIGWTPSIDPGRVWLFLEEIDGVGYDKRDPDHVALASRWLAAFHSGTSQRGFDGLLPGRNPEYYTSLAGRTLDDIDGVAANPALDTRQLGVLRQLSGHLSRFVRSSDSFGDVYMSLPSALVHGDFKGNNMAFSERAVLEDLRVFDWSEAHCGPLAIDTWWVDPHAYRTALKDAGFGYGRAVVDAWTLFGRVIRWVSAVSWELPRLRYQWIDRPMRRMSLYETRLRSTLEASPWL